MFWLPKTLYESMPYLWIAFGLFIMNVGLNDLGEISGVLLVFIGAFQILMRRNYRNRYE